MLRIGIVGSDNSHALAYASLLNVENAAGERARAVAICGADPDRSQEVATKANIETIVDGPAEMLDLVDVAFVEYRHGGLHAENALPFLERGIPVFVDKPFAKSLDDCARMLSAANCSGSWITSFSSLRTSVATNEIADEVASIGNARVGQFAGPCDFECEYGGPIFYATHVAEIAFRLMGEEAQTVRAERFGKAAVATVAFANDAVATFTYLGDAKYRFTASVFGTEGWAGGTIPADHGGYETALGIILDGIESGIRPLTDEQLIRPIAFVTAMEESLANGGKPVDIQALVDQTLAAANG